jgi:hypothetical protein
VVVATVDRVGGEDDEGDVAPDHKLDDDSDCRVVGR